MARVLIIEPDTSVRELLGLQLEYLGYEVATGEDEYDIALVEPGVPEGLAAARWLRANRSDVPVIFVSIRYPTVLTSELRPFAHLVKPFGLRRLASALASATEMYGTACI